MRQIGDKDKNKKGGFRNAVGSYIKLARPSSMILKISDEIKELVKF